MYLIDIILNSYFYTVTFIFLGKTWTDMQQQLQIKLEYGALETHKFLSNIRDL